MKHLESIKHMYEARGFTVTSIHDGNDFDIKTIKKLLLPALVHIYGRNEHVALKERSTRTVKNKC